MSKKLITILLALALAGTTLASCGNDTAEETTAAEETTEAPKEAVTLAAIHEAVINAYGGQTTLDENGFKVGDADYLPNTLTVNAAAWDELIAADPTYADRYNDTFVESDDPEDWVPVNLYKLTDSEEDFYMYFVDPSLCELYFNESPAYMTMIDQFMIIKPVEGKTADVVAALENYNEAQKMMQYPQNIAKAEGAQVYEKGGYVFFIRLGSLPEMDAEEYATMSEDEINESRYNAAVENNKKAIEAIDAILG